MKKLPWVRIAGLSILISFATVSSARSQSVTYGYDEAGRLKSTNYWNGASTTYKLDAAGNRIQVQTTPPVPPPGAPGVPTFTSITTTSATANWSAATGTVTSYSYSTNGGSTWTNVGTALTAALTGLSSGTTYTVQVRASNIGGNGPTSSASLTTLPGAPGTPTFTNITATSATVNWTGTTGAASYAYSTNGGSTWTSVGTALTANITGLSAGTNYTVQVRASDATGTGASSSATLLTLPPAPGVPTFTNITATSATANWTAAAGVVSSYAYSVDGAAYVNVSTALTASLTGLSSGISHTVSVRAVNASGNGAASSASVTTLAAAPGAPGTPTFSNISVTTATVAWTAASGAVVSYSYRVNSGAWINVGTSLSANLSGLVGGTTYTVQVKATNSGGDGPASSASFTTSSTYSDSPTMTLGSGTPPGTSGFLSGSFGALTPTTTSNGYTYTELYDKWAGGMAQTYSFSAFAVTGFTADPGQAWLTSVKAHGVTFTGAAATYSYASGTATWTWRPNSGFGFDAGGSPNPITIVHK